MTDNAPTVREYLEAEHGITLPVAEAQGAPPDGLPARLGRHEVVDRLGAGGMGEVLSALDPDIGREVAVKVIRGRADVGTIAKFAREAQITGQLEHPNIVPLHELGVAADGRLFFTMKRVDGRTLRAVVEEGATARPRLLAAFVAVCDAVGYAHSRGVIHRDLKPDNVMLGAFGEVLVLDWGLARVLGGEVEDHGASGVALDLGATSEVLRTLDGAVVGTPAYMPPEQAAGKVSELDARADVYSLGAILYQLLCGSPPYEGATPWAVLGAVSDGPPRPPGARAEVPRELEAIVQKAMAREPDDRYESAGALAEDVRRWLDGLTVDAARYSPLQRVAKWVSRHAAACAGLAAVGLVVLGMTVVQRRQADATRRDAVRRSVGSAGERLRALPKLTVLREDEAARQRALESALAAVDELERARRLAPDDAAIRRQRRSAGIALAQVATVGGDYGLARQAYAALTDCGATEAEVARWLASVETARNAVRTGWQARVRQMVTEMREDHGYLTVERHQFEAMRYVDAGVVGVLAFELDALSARAEAARAANRVLALNVGDRNVARFACRVIGHQGLAEGAPALIRWLDAAHGREQALEAARALCSMRSGEAVGPIVRAIARFGVDFASGIGPVIYRLPPIGDDQAGSKPDLLYHRGAMRVARGEKEAALRDAEAALALDPRLHRARHLRAQLRSQLGDPQGAMDDLDLLARVEPPSPWTFILRSQIWRRADELAKALMDADRAVALMTVGYEALDERGVVLKKMGRYEEAIASFDRALMRTGTATVLLNRGTALARLRRYEAAIADYTCALALDPNYSAAHYNRALSHRAMNNRAAELADYDAAIALDPRMALALHNRARMHLEAKQLDAALADSKRVVVIRPRWATGHARLANILSSRGEREAAITVLKRAIQLDSTQPVFWLNLGNELARLERYVEADRHFAEGIATAGADFRLFLGRYNCLTRLKRPVEERRAVLLEARPIAPAKAQATIDRLLKTLK